jgi:hypothetical protein
MRDRNTTDLDNLAKKQALIVDGIGSTFAMADMINRPDSPF